MTLTANAQGVLTGKFTIPANVPVGTKRVDFIGSICMGSATFMGHGQVTTRNKRLTLTTHVQDTVIPSTPTDPDGGGVRRWAPYWLWSWRWYSPCKGYYKWRHNFRYASKNEWVTTDEQYCRVCFPNAIGNWYPYDRGDVERPWESVGGNVNTKFPGYVTQGADWDPDFDPDKDHGVSYLQSTAFDPLAQTFLLTYEAQLAALDLWFTAKGTGRQNILVQIREALNGVPTQRVLGQRMLTPEEITLDAWTRFDLPLLSVAAHQEYAIVIGAEDTVSSVATATLGQYDEAAAQHVTTQPYQVGILLSSSNNLSWTTHQTKDLTFRLLAQTYPSEGGAPPTRTLVLPAVEVTDADQLLVMATVERPNAQCNVVFNITAGAKTYSCVDHQIVTLDNRYTGEITWEAVLTGTTYASPLLYKDIQLVAGKRLTSCNYISAALDTKVSPTKLTVNMDVYVDCYLPSSTTVAATAQIGAGWDDLILIDTEVLGDGWTEHHYRLEDIAELQTRLQLVITGTAVKRPRLRNLRVALT